MDYSYRLLFGCLQSVLLSCLSALLFTGNIKQCLNYRGARGEWGGEGGGGQKPPQYTSLRGVGGGGV